MSFLPTDVLDFWFPDTGHQNTPETYAAFWSERMQGGMDDAIISEFADITHAAASGQLDHWAETPRGRLALIVALDQFPRSLCATRPPHMRKTLKPHDLLWKAWQTGTLDASSRGK